MDHIHAWLYYGVQRLRGGVREEDVHRAIALLSGSRGDIQRYVSDRLIATHAATVPTEDWIAIQPIQSKAEYRARNRIPPPKGIRVERRRTSGSSGQPVRFFKDLSMVAQMDAGMWAAYAQHHVHPGQRHARFWGAPRAGWARATRALMDRALARRRLSAFAVSPENNRRFFETLRRFRPTYAYGYPTLISHFADDCEDMGLSGPELGIKVVISTGEVLAPSVRRRLKDFFNCSIVNEYGCSESGILAMECPSGQLHVMPWATHLEILRDQRTEDSEGMGDVLVTDLYGRVHPLLRYRLGDRAERKQVPCDCGHRTEVLSVGIGRSDSLIRLPDGRVVYDAIFAYTVPDTVQKFVIEQTSSAEFCAYVVPTAGTSNQELRNVEKVWQDALGGQVRVRLTVVDEIPFERSGKLRYFRPLPT